MMGFGNLPHQGQSEAVSTDVLPAPAPVEGLKDRCVIGVRDARACIVNRQANGGAIAFQFDSDRRRAMCMGVVEQVAHEPAQ